MLGAPPEEFEADRANLHEAYASLDGPAAAKRFGDLGADVVVARADAAGSLRWPALPCFREDYRSGDLVVLVRTEEACGVR